MGFNQMPFEYRQFSGKAFDTLGLPDGGRSSNFLFLPLSIARTDRWGDNVDF